MKLHISLGARKPIIITAIFYLVLIISCKIYATTVQNYQTTNDLALLSYTLIVPAYTIFIGIYARMTYNQMLLAPIINSIGFLLFASIIKFNTHITQGFGFVMFLVIICFVFTLVVSGITTLFVMEEE